MYFHVDAGADAELVPRELGGIEGLGEGLELGVVAEVELVLSVILVLLLFPLAVPSPLTA